MGDESLAIVESSSVHFSFVDRRHRSGARTAVLTRRQEARLYVRPVGNNGDLGQRSRWRQRVSVERGGWRGNATVVAGRAVHCVRYHREKREQDRGDACAAALPGCFRPTHFTTFVRAGRAMGSGFTLDRRGQEKWQVWKMPANGGAAVQVTRNGGQAALESLDGK